MPDFEKTSWDLTALVDSEDDTLVEKRRKVVEQKSYEFINRWKDRKDYLTDTSVLRQALDEYELWTRNWGTHAAEWYYFMLKTQLDENDPALKAKYNKIEEIGKKIENDIQFFRLRLAKVEPQNQQKFLASSQLKDYRHLLERIFAEARYNLSEPEEKILNLKAPTSHSNWTRMTSGFLSREERTVIMEDGTRKSAPFTQILSLMNSKSKQVRDKAAQAFNDILSKQADVAEAELNSVLQNKKVDDELRGAARPDTLRHLSDDIESDVVDALIEAVTNRFDIPARYYRLKAKLLKLRKMKYHERNIEYGEASKPYSFAEAGSLVGSVLGKVDPEFGNIFMNFAKNGQIDVYPRKGKRSGAFCAHELITQPTYIFLNHTDKLHDVLTLAHEVGHGINNELIKEKQHALNFGTPTSTAEVASTFMEDFVLEEILKQADSELRLAILMQKLNDDVSTIFRQVACYRFEQELHRQFRQKGYLSKAEIGQLFQKHMAAYMGDAVEQSKGSENWWVYWNHIRLFFYVYSYASGLLISKSLQNSVRNNPASITSVKEFLSAGLSDSPKNIFGRLGIDMTDKGFWERGCAEIERLLDETESLALELGKIKQ